MSGLSVICLDGMMNNNSCSKVLLTIIPNEENEEQKVVIAKNILETILDPAIIKIDRASRKGVTQRDFVYTGYKVSLPELFTD